MENTKVNKNKCHHCEKHICLQIGKIGIWGKASERQYVKHICKCNCMLLQLQKVIEDFKSSFQDHTILPIFSFKIKMALVGL